MRTKRGQQSTYPENLDVVFCSQKCSFNYIVKQLIKPLSNISTRTKANNETVTCSEGQQGTNQFGHGHGEHD